MRPPTPRPTGRATRMRRRHRQRHHSAQRKTAKRRRSSGKATSSDADASRTPAPLSISTAVGRRALVPANVYPHESCDERGGDGWEVVIEQTEKRINAALVRFVYARDATGKKYAKEWLKLESLLPL